MATKTRLRRSQSTNKVEDSQQTERKERFLSDCKPVHSHADSLFSTSSGFTNYYGVLNLCLILLVLGNARLFLENIIKYGILINLSFTDWFLSEPYNWPNLALTLSITIFPAIALYTEKLLSLGKISNRTGTIIYVINLSVLLLFPAAIIYYLHPVIAFSIFTLGNVTICFLKLISYGHVNFWCREYLNVNKFKRRSSSGNLDVSQKSNNTATEVTQSYPGNLNVKDLAYFMFAPTLCYELNFPRSARIRKRFLAKRIIEMVFLCWLMVALMQQWIVPAVNNARQPLAEMEAFKMLERLLKLSIPNHLIWLVFFYWFFHSTLNVVAELLRFGDRVFYKDWWNAETVSEFWQHWNIPVHRFATRHVYKPLLSTGCSRFTASCFVFLLSAFFHEYLISVPLRMFKTWAFMGMLMQVPTAYLTSKFVRGKWGNITMWLSLILGQPVAILAYFHDYYIVHSLPLLNNSTATPGL
ncbi:diacylglycerol O-acyltransferase 1-like isoform X2 [Physella acuta]|uniref:diacylglycerol O-acyltransferase 1-like isoform X2 n=1 Tax=Physella acuta TaxID=109671 RepID=UPI0027DE7FB5|nr:diacylglycerol O-acyltransferase 1-like isoform X2 [Physella acuta]